jgi:hypothetical protein
MSEDPQIVDRRGQERPETPPAPPPRDGDGDRYIVSILVTKDFKRLLIKCDHEDLNGDQIAMILERAVSFYRNTVLANTVLGQLQIQIRGAGQVPGPARRP